ncbi:aspartate/glutamate racemase family protein [Lentibacter algarum]|uniref:maleate cis-trans isomerase family protein n=1 Tax=Lentibacter algarum TaxID=576131 RepID=UPI001C074D1B|nr:aspartate/glutamate racemase family protein [Lentibacter algarum]MBU2980830.1 aspartate/glutamate racemase family protein [Lentibacter algarum]
MALPYSLDHRADATKLGLIVLSTDETLENEARQVLAGRDVRLVHTRIMAEPEVTPAALEKMKNRLPAATELLPIGLDAIGYACTSAATVIGPGRVAELVQKRHVGAQVSNPITAVMAALSALNARKIALVTPYVKEVNAPMKALLRDNHFSIVSEGAFEQSDDKTVAQISETSTLKAIVEVANSECDAVFVSCTNLRSFGIIEQAERAVGRPVVSSNQALLWHMLRLSKVQSTGWGPGQLFKL